MTASSCDDYPFDRCAANQARFALPTVHPMLQLEKPFFAVGINIVAHRRPSQRNGFAQHFLNRCVQLAQLLSRERGGSPTRTYSGAEERLVGVNISHSAQKLLVEQRAFDRGLASAK